MAADSANMAIPESEKKFRWVKCGLLTKSCTQRMALCTSSSQIITRPKLMTNRPPKVTGPRTIRAVSWKTWKNKISIFQHNDHVTLPYWLQYILYSDVDGYGNQPAGNKTTGHHLCQGGSSSKTAPAVVTSERRSGIQTGKPRSQALDPSAIQKTIKQKTQQMQWRMIVTPDNDRRTETTQTLSNFRTGSHSRQQGGRELF